MNGINRVVVGGNAVKDPELRYTPSGTPVASLALAINRKYKQGDEMKEEVCYIDVVCFGRTAENVSRYVKKGDPILVDGRIQQRRWETDDGQKRSKHEVAADAVHFLSNRREGADGEEGRP